MRLYTGASWALTTQLKQKRESSLLFHVCMTLRRDVYPLFGSMASIDDFNLFPLSSLRSLPIQTRHVSVCKTAASTSPPSHRTSSSLSETSKSTISTRICTLSIFPVQAMSHMQLLQLICQPPRTSVKQGFFELRDLVDAVENK